MKRIFAFLILAAAAMAVQGQTCPANLSGFTGPSAVTVSATSLLDGGQAPNGMIYFKPVLATGGSASYQLPGGGTATITPFCATVSAGAFSLQMPDVTLTNPPNLCFAATLVTKNGSVLGPGYTCIQPHTNATSPSDWCQAGQCNFDDYVPVLGAPQTNFPGVPLAATNQNDMLTFWNATVQQNGSVAQSNLVDAATVTWNATDPNLNEAVLPLYTPAVPNDGVTPCPLNQLVPALYGMNTCKAIADGRTSRTINMTGLTVNARYLLVINTMGSAAGQQTVTFGSGCAWSFTSNNANISGNTLTISSWVNYSTLVAFYYDGTNCSATVVD